MFNRKPTIVLGALVALLVIAPPVARANANCGSEPSVSGPASWQAYRGWCSCMGGSVAANLNDAQRQGGCRLPSGSGSSSGAASSGDSIGTAIGAAIGKELGKAIFGDPAEKARKDAAAREQALAQQRAAEEAAAEMERKKQESYTRLRGTLKLENFDGDSGGLLLKGVDVESDGDLGLKLGDSGGDLALKVDEGDANSPAPTADPTLVDARNVPSGLPKALDDAIASAFPDVPPGVTDRVRKGFQAVMNRDWKVAKAWFEDALNHDPGNVGLRRLLALTDSPTPSNPQTQAAPTTDKNTLSSYADDFLLVNDPVSWRKKHPDWWKDVPEMVELRNRPTITSTSPDGREVLLPDYSDQELLFDFKPKPVAPAAESRVPDGRQLLLPEYSDQELLFDLKPKAVAPAAESRMLDGKQVLLPDYSDQELLFDLKPKPVAPAAESKNPPSDGPHN